MFVAEVKNYSSAGDQGSEYRLFLAKCYRIETYSPAMYEHYVWLTWAPFLVSSWKELITPEFVAAAVEGSDESQSIALGSSNLSEESVEKVASKLMIVVLSERQVEFLSLHGDELLNVKQALLEIRDGL
ncbi:MAG: hypothetical protein U9N56_07880 [Actinomycetota bacterium]|nr:hypothetical protein [Actinomycetota bacterium]